MIKDFRDGQDIIDLSKCGAQNLNLKKYFKERALAVFVRVKDETVLEQRLRHRKTESEESLKKRLAKAAFEMTFENGFDKTVISDQLEMTLKTSREMVKDFLGITKC